MRARLGISRTFQDIRIFPQISVLENILLATQFEKGESFISAILQSKEMKNEETENRKRALQYLEIIGLLGKKDDLAQNLSHGQRRLLELARAMAMEPDLILLDEPTADVFPVMKNKIVDMIRGLKENGKTVFFIEHDLGLVRNVAENIIVMNYGEKIGEGIPEQVLSNERVIEAYLGRKFRNAP